MYCGKCGRAIPRSSSRCLQCGQNLPPNLDKQTEAPVTYWSAAHALEDCARQEGFSITTFKIYRIYFAVMLLGLLVPTSTDEVDKLIANIPQTRLQFLLIIGFISIVASVMVCVLLWRASENAFMALLAYTACSLIILPLMPRMSAEALVMNIIVISVDAYMCYYLYVRKTAFRRFNEVWRKHKR